MIDLHLRLRRGGFRLALDARITAPATGVFGPSGSGKSSLLHAVAGLLPADELRLAVNGDVLVDTAIGLVPPTHQRRIGVVFQDHRLFPHLSVAANLRYGMATPGRGRWDEVIGVLDIADLLNRRPDQCSGGQRQRIALGRALLAEPRLLLLDEPLASLDRRLTRQILPYLRRIRERFQIPLLMVSHDLDELLSVADDLLLLRDGTLAAHGDVTSLAQNPEHLGLLHDAGLVCVLPGRLNGRLDGLASIVLDGDGQARIACPDDGLPSAGPVEVLLRPDDLVLARPPLPEHLSLSNRFTGTVRFITVSTARCIVGIDIGATRPVLAEVAERAVRHLAVQVGDRILVLVKAQAVQARTDALPMPGIVASAAT
jgi:molybdate transport system ATP-binding protein